MRGQRIDVVRVSSLYQHSERQRTLARRARSVGYRYVASWSVRSFPFRELTPLMLSLHLLQVCLVYINTLMIQQVLAEPEWQGRLTSADRRGLTPLVWQHVNPYGTFTLNMHERLPLEQTV